MRLPQNQSVSGVPVSAPGSVDMVRVIRRSMRCFVFGVIGLIPLFGVGLAVQAVRLQRRVAFEMKDVREAPPVYLFWLAGLVLLWAADGTFGGLGDVTVGVLLLGLQSWQVWRRFTLAPNRLWNPGHRQLQWGVVFAYAGMSLSLWMLGVLICRVTRTIEPV